MILNEATPVSGMGRSTKEMPVSMYKLTLDEQAHGKELLATHPGLKLIFWKRDIGASPIKMIRRIIIRELIVLGVYYAYKLIQHELILKGHVNEKCELLTCGNTTHVHTEECMSRFDRWVMNSSM